MDTARDFAARLASLLRREQGAMADFLVALADFDDRRLWLKLGHSSLFTFLHRELGLSKGASHFRKVAAELVQRFPEVVEPLRDGRLCITSVVELARVLTPENRREVLPRFFHSSKQEAKAVAAELRPLNVVPRRAVVTAAAPRVVSGAPVLLLSDAERCFEVPSAPPTGMRQVGAEVRPVEPVAPVGPPAGPVQRTVAEPLTADARRLHVTVSRRFLEKLEAAKDALSHSHPGADAEAILEAGLDLLIERAAKRKGIVARPRAKSPPHPTLSPVGGEGKISRAIPAAVKREVWIRDGGRCQWPTSDGGVCGSTCRVQYDHILPVGRGGRSTVEGLRILCAFHNDLAAREVYGDAWMDKFTRTTRQPPLPAAPT